MAPQNKLGITSSPELAESEERISKKKAAELFENGMLDTLEVGTFASLKAIHKYLFEDIYDFAGELRTQRATVALLRLCTLKRHLPISTRCHNPLLTKSWKSTWK